MSHRLSAAAPQRRKRILTASSFALVASLAVTADTSAYTHTIVGLQPSTTYRLAVSASSAVGDSDLSAVAAVTTPSQ